MESRLCQNWTVAYLTMSALMSSAAFGYLAGFFFWQGAAISLSIYAIAISIINAHQLFFYEPDPTEELRAIVLMLIEELRSLLLEIRYRQMEGFI